MKTERMVLLVTPAEKAKIGTEAEKLGVSASEYVRRLVGVLDADDLAAIEQFSLIAPELNTMADRLEQTFAEFRAEQKVRDERWAYMGTPEYREDIRREVLDDPSIDWDKVRETFWAEPRDHGVAAE